MSLTSIKQKELKGKKNVMPKLRTVLANPYKQRCPVLPENELAHFRNILKDAISKSKHPLKTFATQTHIHLGLESSLRAINGQRFSCVFLSLSIRPSHILRLIATSAEVKAPTAPIYAQHKLEELTQELFGVRALTLVLSPDLDCISPELAQWVNARQKPLALPKPQTVLAAPKKSVKRLKPVHEPLSVSIEQQVVAPSPAEQKQKQWSGDYISCIDGEVLQLDEVDVQAETKELGEALSNMAMRTAQRKTASVESTPKTQESKKELAVIEHMQVDSDKDDDEFLPASKLSVYQAVTVHQIRPNPDKKPKKKRNKHNKKSKVPLNKTNE